MFQDMQNYKISLHYSIFSLFLLLQAQNKLTYINNKKNL